MAEWSKAVDSKSTMGLSHRGFESLSLRHSSQYEDGRLKIEDGNARVERIEVWLSSILDLLSSSRERCESGRIGAPGERVDAKSVPWVRIPPSPL